jgi:GntR family transcriptional regulator
MPTLLPITIDKSSPVPIYVQLQRGLIGLIEAGSLKHGDVLPSETDLSKRYRISPMTVRQAMTELVKHGYVRRERGRGTFVAPRPLDHPLDKLVGFSEDMRAKDLQPSARILLLERCAVPDVVVMHGVLASGTPMLRLKRVRMANEQPVGIHDAYLANVDITRDDLAKTPSLYELLAQRGIVLGEGTDTIDATAANHEAADILHVKVGAPLLRTTRFAWDTRGQFIEYVVALYREDLYQYRIRLRRL